MQKHFFEKQKGCLDRSMKRLTIEDFSKKDHAGLAQLVEQLTLNQLVRGSSPRSSTKQFIATLAQLVEQLICNHQVVGSIPTGGSTFKPLFRKDQRLLFQMSLIIKNSNCATFMPLFMLYILLQGAGILVIVRQDSYI